MKTTPVSIRLDLDIKEKLQKIADKEMRTLNNLVKKILTEYLQEYEKNLSKPSNKP